MNKFYVFILIVHERFFGNIIEFQVYIFKDKRYKEECFCKDYYFQEVLKEDCPEWGHLTKN